MRVLVTGGSGFIGSHTINELKSQNHKVIVFDTVTPSRKDIEFFRGDLLNDEAIIKASKGIDVIYHLGAIADVDVALSYPKWCLTVNEIGTINTLQAAITHNVSRVILASTTWVYGKTPLTVTEYTPLPLPDHIYTKTKLGQEQLVHAWHEHYGLPYTILRYDIPYGPKMRKNMAIDIFIRNMLQNKPITIFGDGKQGRCFIYITDLAKGNVAALQEKAKNQIFNLAGTEFITLNHIVNLLQKMNNKIQVTHDLKRRQDFLGVSVSIEKAKKLLNWEPKIPFYEGLLKYVDYVKKGSEQNEG